MLAFVFIKVEVDAGSRVAAQIAKVKGVEELHELTGDIDLIAKISASDIDELSKVIFKVREIKGVQGTDTRIVLATIRE